MQLALTWFALACFLVACWVGAVPIGASGGQVRQTNAARTVYLPLIFHAEQGEIQTTACMKVLEYRAESDFGKAGRAFRSVIAAIKKKDHGALLELSHPTEGRDPARFDRQAAAFFKQFEAINVDRVEQAIEIGDYVIVNVVVAGRNRSISVPFVFKYASADELRFLPYRTDHLGYTLVNDWYRYGMAGQGGQRYCSDSDVKAATHWVQLSQPLFGTNIPRLLLAGEQTIDGTGDAVHAKISVLFDRMKDSLARNSIDAIAASMTIEGSRRLRSWWESASDSEKTAFRQSIQTQVPYFLFRADPLIIVYTRGRGGVQPMYFIMTDRHDPRWSNAFHVTIVDEIFKRGQMIDGASMRPAFKNLEIH